jgi:hypothetical protein
MLAVCLDGSPPGYHLQRGFGSGEHSWLVFLEVIDHASIDFLSSQIAAFCSWLLQTFTWTLLQHENA